MKNIVLGCIFGVLVTSLFACFYFVTASENEFERGRNQGVLEGQAMVIDQIKPYVPLVGSDQPVDILISVKTVDLVTYLSNGESKLGIRK
ncbi:TPA: hypothetical protein NJ611_002513 [Vibrio parahaemolyticus]|nr:hypothetical protein [Vibrio parahaemolyticus]